MLECPRWVVLVERGGYSTMSYETSIVPKGNDLYSLDRSSGWFGKAVGQLKSACHGLVDVLIFIGLPHAEGVSRARAFSTVLEAQKL